jgi:glutamyl/glutaminyl-tRNA synthetase
LYRTCDIVNNQASPTQARGRPSWASSGSRIPAQALFNFLCCSRAPRDDREVTTREDGPALTLERCNSSARRFDVKKLVWREREYIRRQPREVYAASSCRACAAGLSARA